MTLESALERIRDLEEHLRVYVTEDEDEAMVGSPCVLVVYNRRILASRKLLGLGHMGSPLLGFGPQEPEER